MTLDYPHGLRDDDYTPASDAYNLGEARAMLDKLYGIRLDAKSDGVGRCADCSRETALLAYTPTLHVCRQCAERRRRVAARLGKEGA